MKKLLGFLLAVAACTEATAPPPAQGPGCEWSRPIQDIAILRVRYADCTSFNVDSLEADGWTITWDRK